MTSGREWTLFIAQERAGLLYAGMDDVDTPGLLKRGTDPMRPRRRRQIAKPNRETVSPASKLPHPASLQSTVPRRDECGRSSCSRCVRCSDHLSPVGRNERGQARASFIEKQKGTQTRRLERSASRWRPQYGRTTWIRFPRLPPPGPMSSVPSSVVLRAASESGARPSIRHPAPLGRAACPCPRSA